MASGNPDFISQEKEYVQKFFLPFNTNITEQVYYGTVNILAWAGTGIDFPAGAGFYRQIKSITVYSDAGACDAYIQVQIVPLGPWLSTFRVCGSVAYEQGFEDYERAMIYLPAWNIRIALWNDSGVAANLSYVVKYSYQTS